MRTLTRIHAKEHIVKYKMLYALVIVVIAFGVLGFYSAIQHTADFIAQDIYQVPVSLK